MSRSNNNVRLNSTN